MNSDYSDQFKFFYHSQNSPRGERDSYDETSVITESFRNNSAPSPKVEGTPYPGQDPSSIENLKAFLRCRIAELEVEEGIRALPPKATV